MRVMAFAAAVVLSGCSIVNPVVIDCELEARCAEVIAQANRVLPAGAEEISIGPGRAPPGAFHAEVHACYPDGGYLLVDVMGSEQRPLSASIRDVGWADPPCR